MKKLVSIVAVFVLAILASCSTTGTDFQEAAEKAAVDAVEEANPDFTAEASCEEPSSTDVGTTFTCTVTYSDGEVVDATAEILEDDKVTVLVSPSS